MKAQSRGRSADHTRNVRLFLITLFFLLFFTAYPVKAAAPEPVVIEYYFMEACGACVTDTENALTESFWQAASQSLGKAFTLKLINTFTESGYNALLKAYGKFGVPKRERDNTALFAGNGYLIGNKDISEKLATFLITAQNAAVTDTPPPDNLAVPKLVQSGYGPTVVFFSITACADCDAMRKAIAQLAGGARVVEYNIADEKSLALYPAYVAAYAVPENRQLLPIAFAGKFFFNLAEAERGDINALIWEGKAGGTLVPNEQAGIPVLARPLGALEFYGVFLAGLLGGVNPCGISMFLFLLSLIAAGRNRMLLFGFSFLAGKLGAYWTLGAAGYKIFSNQINTWLDRTLLVFNVILIAACLSLAALYVNDFFAARGSAYARIRLQLPARLRLLNQRFIRYSAEIIGHYQQRAGFTALLTAGCFALGAVISFTEFLCTGQIYVATILYAIRQGEGFTAYLFLLVYTIAAVLPPVAILLALRRGLSVLRISEFFRAKLPAIKLLGAFFFTAFAVYLLIEFYK